MPKATSTRSWIRDEDVFCVICGRSARSLNTDHRNHSMCKNFSFHTQCIKDKVAREGNPIDTCRMLNIPYIEREWINTIKEVDGDIEEAIVKYIKLPVLKEDKYQVFMDSEFSSDDNTDDLTDDNELGLQVDFEVTTDILTKWGPDLEPKDYYELELYYRELVGIQEPRTKLEVSNYIDNAWLKKRSREVMMSGQANEIKSIREAYTKSLNDLGLSQKSMNERSTMKSVGQRIKEWEEEEPIPEISKEFNDIDNIKKYFQTFFITPLLRNFGQATSEEIADLDYFQVDEIPGSEDGD